MAPGAFRAVVGSLVLLLTGAASADTLDGLVVASAAADLYTTEVGLRRSGMRELNPFAQSSTSRVAVKGLAVAVTLVGAQKLKEHGHRRAAKVAKIAIVVLWSGAAVNNAIQARRARP